MSALLAKAALFESLERPKKAVGDFCLFFKAVVCLDRFMLLIGIRQDADPAGCPFYGQRKL